jgi:hypothetical protein
MTGFRASDYRGVHKAAHHVVICVFAISEHG